tara:strand:+ start:329 stop:1477 length:1149 start_codon:yes stop_codon:yes gene_type:complete
MKKFLKQKSIWIPLLMGILFSLTSNLLGWDLKFQDLFWNDLDSTWNGKTNPLSKWLYYYGIIPALALSFSGLFILLLGYFIKRLAAYRKIALYLFLTLAIGNGLVVNGLFKEFWGRPRPAQIIDYNSTQSFEPSLCIDSNSTGKSFPCGHATMGFYFLALGLLFKAGSKRNAIFAFALVFGLAIGIARSSMGGHFITDTAWAAIMMWIVIKGLYFKIGLNQKILFTEEAPKSKKEARRRRVIKYSLIPLVFIFIGVVLIASPRDKSHNISLELPKTEHLDLNLQLKGTLKIVTNAESFSINTHAVGFGFPKTRLIVEAKILNDQAAELKHKILGFFSELNAETTLFLPNNHRYNLVFMPPLPKAIYLDNERFNLLTDALLIE